MAYNNNKDDYKVDNIVIELDTDEDTEEAEKEYIANITAKIMTITNEFISRHPNIDLGILWDIYTVICCTCRIKPTLMRYSVMTGIDNTTITSWINGEYAGRVSSGHSQTAKKWKSECESSLYDEVIQTGNIGCMFALKANYGYRDNIQIIQSDGRDLLPEYSREEIAARAKVVDLLPDSPDDLPD